MQGFSTSLHGILGQPREIVLALLPSIVLILGALLLAALRGRRSQLVSLISAGAALVLTGALSQQLPVLTEFALWRPVELFGSGSQFRIDEAIWPILFMGAAVIFAEVLLDGRSRLSLLYAGIALASVVAGNLITIAILWTLMILLESAFRITRNGEVEAVLRKMGAQFAAVLAITAAAFAGELATGLLVLAVIIRAFGGTNTRTPFTIAIMAPLAALAVIDRTTFDSATLPWLALAIVALALSRSLLLGARLRWFALTLTATTLIVLPGAHNVVSVSAGVALIVTVGMLHLAGSRVAWLAIAVIPMAIFPGGATGPDIWVAAILATAVLTVISRLLPGNEDLIPADRIEGVSLGVLIAAALTALLSSDWAPSLGGVLSAGVGLTAGFAISRTRPALANMQPRASRLIEDVYGFAGAALRSFAGAIRTTVDVLEGESAVLWILLVLLIAIIGLQVIAV